MKRNQYAFLTTTNRISDDKNLSFSRKTLLKSTGLHWHGFYEIEVIIDGQGTQNLNGQLYPLQKGCVTILTPLDFHQSDPDGALTIYNLMFRSELFNREDDLDTNGNNRPSSNLFSLEFLRLLCNSEKDHIIYFNETEFAEILSICQLLEAEYTQTARLQNILLQNLLECFIILLLRKIQPEYNDSDTLGTELIQKSILFLQQNFKNNPSLSETAIAINLNANYFSQRFKESTGQNFIEYLTGLKLSYAKKLLRTGTLSVTEVCFASGFTSLSNFMKVFRSKTGCTPTQYMHQES